MVDGPLSAYHALRQADELKPDPAQEHAAAALQHLHEALIGYAPGRNGGGWAAKLGLGRKPAPPPRGLYIHGPVGRGKSMLMDLFFEHAPVAKKRRVHFHEFMIEVHDAVHAWRQDKARKSDRDPLPQIAEKIAGETWLLCFDEFHVTNIADAMILGRLFTALFENGVVVVTTSNFAPDDLYKDGLQRARFVPFIELLKERLDILELSSPTDYRLARMKAMRVFHAPLGPSASQALERAFEDLTEGTAPDRETLTVKGRAVEVPAAAAGVACFSFDALCGQPLGAEDYIRIAEHYHTIILDGVPRLTEDRRNEAKRFMTLIDALYEHKVKLVMAAETPPHDLHRGKTHGFEFERTVSRLMEMQSNDYLAAGHREAAE
jgi:cell division protein ZapE